MRFKKCKIKRFRGCQSMCIVCMGPKCGTVKAKSRNRLCFWFGHSQQRCRSTSLSRGRHLIMCPYKSNPLFLFNSCKSSLFLVLHKKKLLISAVSVIVQWHNLWIYIACRNIEYKRQEGRVVFGARLKFWVQI